MINYTKSIVGHCLWSAGIVEAITTLIQMQEGFVHTNKNLKHPITKKCAFVIDNSKYYEIECAISNSFDFAGINITIVLAKHLQKKTSGR